MDQRNLTIQQIAEQGTRVYDERLKEVAERNHWGQFLVVDIETGDFEIADEDIDATDTILKRRPDAILYGIRIGDEVAYRFGHANIASS